MADRSLAALPGLGASGDELAQNHIPGADDPVLTAGFTEQLDDPLERLSLEADLLTGRRLTVYNRLVRRGPQRGLESLMALVEIPQGRSSKFPTLGGCHCSGRRVPVAA